MTSLNGGKSNGYTVKDKAKDVVLTTLATVQGTVQSGLRQKRACKLFRILCGTKWAHMHANAGWQKHGPPWLACRCGSGAAVRAAVRAMAWLRNPAPTGCMVAATFPTARVE